MPEDRSALAMKAIRAVMLRAADRPGETRMSNVSPLVCPPLLFVFEP